MMASDTHVTVVMADAHNLFGLGLSLGFGVCAGVAIFLLTTSAVEHLFKWFAARKSS